LALTSITLPNGEGMEVIYCDYHVEIVEEESFEVPCAEYEQY
jgi:hypothetical protein